MAVTAPAQSVQGLRPDPTDLKGLGNPTVTTIIASRACVDPRAELAVDVEIGPYCVIGPEVRIGRGTRLAANVCISGRVTIGEFNRIGPFVSIGDVPQDVSYRGSPTRVDIGDCNFLGNGVTIHRASEKEDGITRIGSRNTLLASSHVAHDCKLGDNITIGEWTMLGGHVHVEDHAGFAVGVAIIHNVTIGAYSFVGMKSKATQDVPRYMRADGIPSKVRRVNASALKRKGISKAAIAALEEAYRLIYLGKMRLPQAADLLRAHGQYTTEVQQLIEGIETQRRGKNGRAREHSLGKVETPE
ncbi:acyl-(acyl-carrier-protein)--UDP-N-acetylglucosamine O-acyltransferase [Singulisphaera acidiphila DSM 18658]|uniref:Acyl-(Acyl-carrier-protein)--UDP-N-acetylglucosamine O-acyltransferase n=1 Tax=Singulisphaera acidiphila (strain ATCC BAA-1392 / DSM 18658 / VKM B-2454 / MOB10) TaxID=886293 RepID=L0DLZ9_SINAD|nr:acyl-(acyl-carrier-protein)--UDP-N-acetylglucosamine O-acyltransferase [Singulisphaera acidiphila DSM 18658]